MTDRGTQLQLTAPKLAPAVAVGDSVAVNGCCLTVSGHRDEQLTFDVLEETLDRTNLKRLQRDSRVNLERALAAGAPLGGHFVQGHIDCSAKVISFDRTGEDYRLEVDLPADFAHYAAYKGSVAINGISSERRVRHSGQIRRADAGTFRTPRLTVRSTRKLRPLYIVPLSSFHCRTSRLRAHRS